MPKQPVEAPKSFIKELSSVSESDDEKKDFLSETLGIIGVKKSEESKATKAIGDELDSLFRKRSK